MHYLNVLVANESKTKKKFLLVHHPDEPGLSQDKARTQELHLGLLHEWQGSRHLDDPLLFSQAH